MRKHLWCLCDKEPLPKGFLEVPHDTKSLQKMGFSSQYFFLTTLLTLGMMFIIYAIEFWMNVFYHPLRDICFLFILLLSIVLCIALDRIIIFIGKLCRIW